MGVKIMGKKIGIKIEKLKILLMTALLLFAVSLIYYFHVKVQIFTIYTHFFYIPISLACIWWGMKGILVALFLSLNLFFCHFFCISNATSNFDFIRPLMFLFVAFLIVELRNKTAKAEEKTKIAHNKINQIFHTIGNGLLVIDKNYNIIQSNKAFLDLMNLSQDEVIGKKCFETYYGPLCDTPDCTLKQILKGKNRVESNLEKDLKDGSKIFVDITATPLKGQRGEIIGIVENLKDITDCKFAEESLRKSEERYHSFVKNLKGIAYQRDIDFSPVFFHGAVKEITGYTEDDFIANNPKWEDIINKNDLSKVIQNWRKLCRSPKSASEFEYRINRKDGQVKWLMEIGQNICDESGKSVSIQGIFYDITERKEAEDALLKSEEKFLQVQKMESIGRLAGGIAHDFNNILTVINGNTELLLNELDKDHPRRHNLELIHRAGDRATSLTSRLLAFGRKQMLHYKVIDLNTLLREINKLLRQIIGEDIEIVTIFEPSLKNLKADPGQIEQIMLNLAINARDAMPQGGTLTIRTENVMLNEKQCKNLPDAYSGKFVRFSIEDTGMGMDKATMNKIFDPFFTTKKPTEGTGLGLSSVYGIVKQHEGWVNINSELGYGTTFEIYLPALSLMQSDKIPIHTPSLQQFQGKGERILLVEDDDGVRHFTKSTLEKNGYTVFEAANALNALSIFDRENGDFYLVLCDVVLPDINGVELIEKLLSQNPQMLVLFCSGYCTDHKSQWSIIKERNFCFLKKPYNTYDLLRAIKEAQKLHQPNSIILSH